MTRWAGSMAVAIGLALPLAATANFRQAARHPAVMAYSYYYPVAVWCVPVPVICPPPPPVCVPMAPPLYATPTPAGPSTSPPPLAPPPTNRPPPAGSGAPAVSESKYFDSYPVTQTGTLRPAGEHCLVSFWNLSDRDVTLRVGGTEYPLAKGKSLTFDVPRRFEWQMAGRETRNEDIAGAECALEIVLRR